MKGLVLCFLICLKPYSLDLIEKTKKVADSLNIDYEEGVYMACTGPNYETAAEIRAFKVLGADAVGMSTVPKTIVANYLGLEVLGISCITNMATGIQKFKHSHDRVVETAKKVSENFCNLVYNIVKEL